MLNCGVMEFENRRRIAASYSAKQRERKRKSIQTLLFVCTFSIILVSFVTIVFAFPSRYREENGTAFITTEDGHIWKDEVTLVFDTKGTTDITDDEICDIISLTSESERR